MSLENGKPIIWENLTYEDIRELTAITDIVIIPVGSTEQHGPHLPLNVDALITYEIALAVSAKRRIPVAPLIKYGPSMTHKNFPGTISVKPQTLLATILDICKCIRFAGFHKILILNGHVPNEWVLKSAMDILRARFDDLRIKVLSYFNCSEEIYKEFTKDNGDHANCFETSLMLYLRPDMVKISKIQDEPAKSLPFDYRYDQKSRTGVWGKPSLATREEGERLFNKIVEAICQWVDLASKAS
jgi:creatinine amidohydrolase